MSVETKSESPAVEIALSTYNGARFIEEQLDSYLRQSFGNWALVVRDDASNDDTVDRIEQHAARHGYPLRFTPDSGQHAGYPDTFYLLFEQTRAPVVLFSDQDDVWLPDKMSLLVEALNGLPSDRPALVHSDLTIVNAALSPIHPSYLRHMRAYPPRSDSVLGLLCWTYVTGCTIAVNARAREVFRRPKVGAGHDSWMALTCATTGSVRFLDQPTVLYRQHTGNVVGVGARPRRLDSKRWSRLSFEERQLRNRIPLAVAEALLECYGPHLTSQARHELEWFARVDALSVGALLSLRRRGILPPDPGLQRRVLWQLMKIQVKNRLLRVEERYLTRSPE